MANLNLNKVILGGRLTADVELKQTPNGVPVSTFSIAVNRKTGKETDFISCVAWRQTAEFVSRYFGKGSSILVIGSLQVRSFEDKNKQKRQVTEVVVDEVNFVDSKAEATQSPSYAPSRTPSYSSPEASSMFEEVGEDDDLPF